MSLVVKLNRFKVLKCKYGKYARLEFRGESKYTPYLPTGEEIIVVNQRFEWSVLRPIDPGETVLLQLMTRGRWGNIRLLGVYRLGLQIVVTDGQIAITDSLLNDLNKPVSVYVDMEVYYHPPIGRLRGDSYLRGERRPLKTSSYNIPAIHGVGPEGVAQAYETQSHPQPSGSGYASSAGSSRGFNAETSPKDSVENVLDDVGRNIAAIEQNLREKEVILDIDDPQPGTSYAPVAGPSSAPIAGPSSGPPFGPPEPETRAFKLKSAGKRFLRRGFTLGGDVTIDIHPSERKRPSTLNTVKTFMRIGRNRPPRESSDEEMGLLDPQATSSEAERPVSPTSASSDDVLVAVPSPTDPRKIKKTRTAIEHGIPAALKAADFQVCVTIIEARQLAGLNMDPVVCVQIGDMRKYTSVKESTNCPYYNEYFVFDFHMPPVMLFDKIIILSVLQSRNILRANKLLGNFKLDVATVWSQPDRQFYHKWALLTDPEDVGAGAKGYLKCDISVIGKGDSIKVPPKSEKDEDDIEANLLLPDGIPMERQRARFIVKIHKADGLPKMNYSLLANMKRAFTGESHDLVNAYVQVSFAGMTGNTCVRKYSYSPVWNEQIVFTEMFPPLCQRIKLQLRDNHPVHPGIIGTHFLDLKTISNDGDKGFLPTFGPAYIYLYGSTRDFSMMDQLAGLNSGMGEGVQYRGRVLISIRTEIIEGIEYPLSDVEVEPIPPINDISFEKHEEFFLFASVFEVNLIDKRIADKPLIFELSIGNSGNSIDGYHESAKRAHDLEVNLDEVPADTGYWQSTTAPIKPASTDKTYYFLPYWDTKQCMHIRSIWPDYRRRMYNSNLIANIIEKYEEDLAECQALLEAEPIPDTASILKLKTTLETVSVACKGYVKHMTKAPPLGNTKLDKERQKLCIYEIDQIASMSKSLRALITKHSIKERLRTAYDYLDKLKHLCEDAQHGLPDIFIWLISNGKRIAYQRIPARDIIYSSYPNESGKYCGSMQTLFLKWPGKKSSTPSGWSIPAMLNVYLWLGILEDKPHYIDGLPQGYELGSELKNAEKLRANAPAAIFYVAKHNFQMRAYIYQARSLIGSDSSGLSDPFARIVVGDTTATTQVIDETLSPTWDELLLFDDVLLYSTMEQIKSDPPTIVVEIFDQDKVGKSEFIGRTLAKPRIRAHEDIQRGSQNLPALEWYEITRGDDAAGELLASFEMLEIPPKQNASVLPSLPSPRENVGKSPMDINKGPILPVPKGIRPTLSTYRIEVLFWGLRDMKRIHLMTVDRPRVDIECAGHILCSTVIQNAKRNPNFTSPQKFVEVELPDQDLYRPPLTIRVVDCRSFGRSTLVGTHTIKTIKRYIYTPKSKRERDIEERKKSVIPLQNIDLRANCIIPDDDVSVETEKENSPLLLRDSKGAVSYGSGRTPSLGARKKVPKRESTKKRKASTTSMIDDDGRSKDWWTKYFASVESMIEEEKEAKRERQEYTQPSQGAYASCSTSRSPRVEEIMSPRSDCDRERDRERERDQDRAISLDSPISREKKKRPMVSPKIIISPSMARQTDIPRSSLAKIYPHELEAVPEYDGFKEWLQSFELYRGKKTGDDTDNESRVVGSFKGAVKVYKWPLPKGIDDHPLMGPDPTLGFFHGVPNNEPIHVLVRVYIVKATDLHPMDLNGKADPYIVLHSGSKRISDKDHYVSKQLNPVFGKCFEIEATFPQDSLLTIQVLDWDLLGADDLIGETKIDLENRFYSRHRATCGLPMKYEEQGYNRWRDAMKPTQILAKLCKDGKLDPPIYEPTRVKIGRTIFNMPMNDTDLFGDPETIEEQMALVVLRRWEEVPRVGTKLVTEHVETRPLYNPSKPGIEQGRLQMWVDMFPMDMPLPGPPMDISPRKPRSYEMRVIIWNTDDVVLEDDAFFTGEKMSDIYVKGWVKGPDDCQSTDIHYRSLTGEGNFNWRFIYPFDYLEAEERIVISRKESVFSWDETECKIPARLELQVWDADHFSADDFLGAVTLDLSRFPRGAKTSKLCTLDMLKYDGSVPMVNIFKQKRVKGWWPFYIKRDTEEMELTGKVEAEIHLLTREEADKVPAGLGRSEPDPLDKPNRPDASFMWFLNPLKSIRYIVWHNYKWNILKISIFLVFATMILLLVYAVPGYTIKRLLGA